MTKSTLLFIWIVLHFSLFFRLCIRICFNVQNKNPSRKYLNFVSVSQASSVSHESEEQRWKSGKGCCAYFMAVDFSWLNSAALGCPGCWFINFSLAFCSLLWLLFLSRLLALTSIAIERTYNQCAHLADTICTYICRYPYPLSCEQPLNGGSVYIHMDGCIFYLHSPVSS